MNDYTELFREKASPAMLDSLYLVRGYQAENPYAMVTDLPDDEARRVSNEAFPDRHDDYLDVRKGVDAWLRSKAIAAGIEVNRKNSICFAVVQDLDSITSQLGPDDKMVIFPFKDLDMSNWSFTVDDSFVGAPKELKGDGEYADFEIPDHPLHGSVLNAEQLLKCIEKDGYLDGQFSDNPRYFEAQLWNDTPVLLKDAPQPRLIVDSLEY